MSTITQNTPSQEQRYDRFERRIGFAASGGKFCDGWILAVIGVVLPAASLSLDMSPTWEALIGSAALVGLFVGGLIFGRVTDYIGRKKMFLFTLLTFLICSILQIFVTDEVQLLILRLIMGLAVGADYAIAGAMVAEFTSKRRRGPYLAGMIAWWYTGFSVAATMAIVVQQMNPNSTELWRWILGSSAVPALVMIIARIGLPESPRWLADQGRTEEARVIAERYLAPATREDVFQEESEPATYSTLFSQKYIRKTALTSIFWMAQVAPFYAIYTYLPRVLDSLNLGIDANWGQVLLYGFLMIGSFLGTWAVNRVGRRRLLIWPFAIMAVTLSVLGVWPEAPAVIVVSCFIIFAFFSSASGVLQMLYPAEIFPTNLRATGIGFASGMSRVGAAIGTFLLPLGLVHVGVGPVMLASAAILLVGMVVSIMWAPETTNLQLSAATSVPAGTAGMVGETQEEDSDRPSAPVPVAATSSPTRHR